MNCDALCALTQAANQPYRAADIIDDSVCVSKKRVACENFPQSAIIQLDCANFSDWLLSDSDSVL